MILLVRQGTAFAPRYVDVLTAQIRKPHPSERIVTLTDQDDTPGETVPLRTNLDGWWAKLELFAPWNEHLRPALYLDLDTYVLGDIGDLLAPWESFGMLSDLYYPSRPASGVMALPQDCAAIWDEFNGCPDDHMQAAGDYGDGAFLGQFHEWCLQDHFPGIVSYKRDCRDVPRGRVVCFHGHPRPHDAPGWAAEAWRAAA